MSINPPESFRPADNTEQATFATPESFLQDFRQLLAQIVRPANTEASCCGNFARVGEIINEGLTRENTQALYDQGLV